MQSRNITSREIRRFPSSARKGACGASARTPWIRILAGVTLVCVLGVDHADAAAPSTYRDSVKLFLPEVPLASLLEKYGDSLFIPPEGSARILRDGYGVPHIYGKRDVDVAFGFGYAQAQDHLIPMLLNYRAAAGTASEVLGAGHLESDERALLWRIRSVAVAALRRAAPRDAGSDRRIRRRRQPLYRRLPGRAAGLGRPDRRYGRRGVIPVAGHVVCGAGGASGTGEKRIDAVPAYPFDVEYVGPWRVADRCRKPCFRDGSAPAVARALSTVRGAPGQPRGIERGR